MPEMPDQHQMSDMDFMHEMTEMAEMAGSFIVRLTADEITESYLSRGFSYGDRLQFLCNCITEWCTLPDMVAMVGKSGMTPTDWVAILNRFRAIQVGMRLKSDTAHDVSVRYYGHCTNYRHCWACSSRKSYRRNIRWERTDQVIDA